MSLVRYGQAAMIAAILALVGNAAWAQQPAPASSYVPYGCCKDGKCCKDSECCSTVKKCETKCTSCKDGQCCKDGECCCASKKCDAKCTCCTDSKCSCCKDGKCACDKNGKCGCTKDKTVSTKSDCNCPFLNKLAKGTAIIMVMPASMPMPACCMEAMGMMPHPPMPMPPGPHVFLPQMMPPMPPIPPTPSMGIAGPVMPPMPVPPVAVNVQEANAGNAIYGYAVNSNTCVGSRTVPCSAAKGLTIAAGTNSTCLAMCVGEEDACIRAKKMTITIGDNEISLTRFDDRVRVRGEDLKATASCVRSDRKDQLILEGDVVLHYKRDGHTSHLTGERIELNLSNGTITIQQPAKTPVRYTGPYSESK